MFDTAASVRVTARCHYCTRRFVAKIDPVSGDALLEDKRDELCCDDCLCGFCGAGHAVTRDFDECEGREIYTDPCDARDSADDAYGRLVDEMLELSC